jgi:hypothetical protein
MGNGLTHHGAGSSRRQARKTHVKRKSLDCCPGRFRGSSKPAKSNFADIARMASSTVPVPHGLRLGEISPVRTRSAKSKSV